MELLIFTTVAFLFMIFAIWIDNGDVLSPLVVSFGSYFITSFIAFVYNGFGKWGIDFDTLIILITTLIVFEIGYWISSVFVKGGSSFSKPYIIRSNISGLTAFVLLCFIAIVAIFNFLATLRIARSINSGATIMTMLGYARSAYLFTDASTGTILSIFVLAANGIGYFFTYDIISQFVSKDYRSKATFTLELIGIVASLVNSMLGSGRTFLIKWIVFVIVVTYYLYYSIHKIRRLTLSRIFRMVRVCILAMALFFIAFQMMGFLTGKTEKLSTADMLYGYSGAAIVALDKAIKAYAPDGRFFGEECFYGLYGFLNKFGLNIPNRILHLPFVECGDGLSTNIYCSIRSYLYDFGFWGMYLTQFIIGFISGIMYRLLRLKYYNRPGYLMLYSLVIYGLVMQGIEEILLRNFMSVTNVIVLMIYLILFWLFKKSKIELVK